MNRFKVNEETCIGCGACAAICPEVFDINDNGLAEVVVKEVDEKVLEDAIDAKEGCPTGAIVEAEENLED